MSLSSSQRSSVERFLSEQLPIYAGDSTSHDGLSEYVMNCLLSGLDDLGLASSDLSVRLSSQLKEFFDGQERTDEFVQDLLSQIQQDQPTSIEMDGDAHEEVDYEDEPYEMEHQITEPPATATVADTSATSQSNVADVSMDEPLDSRGSKRKRDEEDGDDRPETNDSDVAAAKRPRTDRSGTGGASLSRPRKPCFDFQRRGQCSRGATCHFEHTPRVTTASNVVPPSMYPPFGAPPAGFLPPGAGVDQQNWQMQQQMAMQFAMQQQFMMQQQQQQQMAHPHPNMYQQQDDTEISLTGGHSRPPQSRHPPLASSCGGSNAPARVGLGFASSSSHSSRPSAASEQKFVRSSTKEMDSTTDQQPEEKRSAPEEKQSAPDAGGQIEEDDEEEYRAHKPTGAGASIPFSYPAPRGGGRGGARGGSRGGRGGRGGASSGGFESSSNSRLFVSGVPASECNLVSLSGHFAQFGSVSSIRIVGTDSAIVAFNSHEEAKAALESEKAVLGNRFIRVDWAKGDGATTPREHTNRPFQPRTFTPRSQHEPSSSSVAPVQSAPLSALEVAKAMMKGQHTATSSTASSVPESTDVTETSSKASDTTAPAASATVVAPRATAADLAAMKAKLQLQLKQKQLAQQKELLSRITNEKDTLTLPEKQQLMAKLAALKAQTSATPSAATSNPHQPVAATPSAAPKLSALEVVAQMRKQQAEAAAAAAASSTNQAEQ